ncbi:MAG: diaminopimelate epimerase [Ignavibacteriaceae bacterium]
MEKVFFTKMSGAGNDFIVIDSNENPDFLLEPGVITKLCDRRNGIGADGVITISDLDNYDFKMDYYNSDGSTKTLCGNGARCAIKFAQSSNRLKNGKASFIANQDTYSGEVLSGQEVKFNLNTPKDISGNLKIDAAGQHINYYYTNTGSPHVVIKIEEILSEPENKNSFYRDINDVPVFEIGKEIRYHKNFLPGGTNVNFIKILGSKILIRTYERGVEDETLACGTGSVASAVIASLFFNIEPPLILLTRGGDELVVNFKVERNNILNLSLSGPAKIIYSGNFLLNAFS